MKTISSRFMFLQGPKNKLLILNLSTSRSSFSGLGLSTYYSSDLNLGLVITYGISLYGLGQLDLLTFGLTQLSGRSV